MSSREIAGLTGSMHDNVLKTVRALRDRGVVFGNETPYVHPQNGQTYTEFNLNFRDTMIVVSGYSVELRARIIDRWQELEARQQQREAISLEMVRDVIRQEIAARQEPVPAWAFDLARSFLASQTLLIRKGKTAGTLWREFGFPPVKGIAAWFGNRLRDLGCAMEHSARAEMGTTTARLFDPDKARAWVENGGRFVIEKRIAERRGQGVLSFVRKPTDEDTKGPQHG
jgi:phage regulator Rha-like protein